VGKNPGKVQLAGIGTDFAGAHVTGSRKALGSFGKKDLPLEHGLEVRT
jgi:hypothetical protein